MYPLLAYISEVNIHSFKKGILVTLLYQSKMLVFHTGITQCNIIGLSEMNSASLREQNH